MPSLGRSAALVVAALVVALLPMAATDPAAAAPGKPGGLWDRSSAKPQRQVDGNRRRVNPEDYAAYTLDGDKMRALLDRAPAESRWVEGRRPGTRSAAQPLVVNVPAPTGELVAFEVAESSVMEPGLAARNPDISTYAGRGVDDPATTVRLDYTGTGFHASVRGPVGQNTWYVDPAYQGDDRLYLSYFADDLPAPQRLVEKRAGELAEDVAAVAGRAGEEVQQRTYRLALATDPSYAAYFGTENVLDEKVTLVNRVNQVYGDDLAIKLELVDATDKINFDTEAKATGANGPCGSAACYTPAQLETCSGSSLTRNRIVLGQLVGADNYDIGHLGLGVKGGGVAGLGVVGGDDKAQGCTGLPTPEGDFYAVDYVAHEMGHQFSGNHTFNGSQANCSAGNREPTMSVEPGSGSSVMSYAGICGQDNLQPHSDPYFSQRSIEEITGYVTSGQPAINEVQTVSLRGFESGESFRLRYGGQTTGDITSGTNYNRAGIIAALTPLLPTGGTVTVRGWAGADRVDADGFEVTFRGALADTDVQALGLVPGTGVAGFVGETATGGAVDNGGTTLTPTGNRAPVVTAPAARSLPIRTPFTLTGSATDADGQPLTYSWEQNDSGDVAGTGLVDNSKTSGPLFRQFEAYAPVTAEGTLESPSPGENQAGVSPTRTFPDMAQILEGNTNAVDGTCPAAPPPPAGGRSNVPIPTVECYAEFLPTAGYVGSAIAGNLEPSLNFRLTARDGNVDGGGTGYADVALTLDKTAGPFLVTSQGTEETVEASTPGTVTWDVAGTDAAALAPTVTVSLSVDGGGSFPYVLAEGVANDGSADVTWPGVDTGRARVKVEAVGNYFFDVNDADFSIASDIAVSNSGDVSAVYSDALPPVTVTASYDGDGSDLVANPDLPAGLDLTVASTTADGVSPGVRTWTVAGDVLAPAGVRPATVEVSGPNTGPVQTSFDVTVTPEDGVVDYTGETTVLTNEGGGGTAVVPLEATVAETDDGTAGDLTEARVRFTDGESGEELCSAPADAAGVVTCEGSVDVTEGTPEPVEVVSTLGGSYAGPPDTETVTVTYDGTPPQTRITSASPRNDRFTLSKSASFSYETDGADVVCRHDGREVACDRTGATLDAGRRTTHVFTVAGVDDAGNVDPTPARRNWTRVRDDRAFASSGGWVRKPQAGAVGGSLLRAHRQGATLRLRFTEAERLAVLVRVGPRRGGLEAYVDGTLVRTFSTQRAARGALIIPLERFPSPRDGLLTLRTRNARRVQVDGVGVAQP